jgi:hypothetical protein
LAVLHEDVRLMISIPDQVARVRLKRHETAVQADRWGNAGAIAGVARRVFADSLDRSRRPVTQVNLQAGLNSGDEVVSERAENNKAAVGADIGLNVQAVSRLASIVDADDLGRSRRTIMYVDLAHEQGRIGFGGKILRIRFEGNEAAIGADGWSLAANICLLSGAVHTDSLGGTQQAVPHEHVGIAIGVLGNEVIRRGHESDEPAIAANCRIGCHTHQPAVRVTLAFAAAHADALGGVREAIVDKRIREPVRIFGDEVVGQRHERDEATIAADGGHVGLVVRAIPAAANADPLCNPGRMRKYWRRARQPDDHQDDENGSRNALYAGIYTCKMRSHFVSFRSLYYLGWNR